MREAMACWRRRESATMPEEAAAAQLEQGSELSQRLHSLSKDQLMHTLIALVESHPELRPQVEAHMPEVEEPSCQAQDAIEAVDVLTTPSQQRLPSQAADAQLLEATLTKRDLWRSRVNSCFS